MTGEAELRALIEANQRQITANTAAIGENARAIFELRTVLDGRRDDRKDRGLIGDVEENSKFRLSVNKWGAWLVALAGSTLVLQLIRATAWAFGQIQGAP